MRIFLSSYVVRSLALCVMALAHGWARLANFVRARALFPESGDLIISSTTEVKYPRNITIGRKVVIGPGCTIGAAAAIYLGDNVHVSKNVLIETGLADISSLPPYRSDQTTARPIRIESGVWIGAGAIILGGVNIGRNSVVAAGTVVRKSVPADTIIASGRPVLQSLAELERQPAPLSQAVQSKS